MGEAYRERSNMAKACSNSSSSSWLLLLGFLLVLEGGEGRVERCLSVSVVVRLLLLRNIHESMCRGV